MSVTSRYYRLFMREIPRTAVGCCNPLSPWQRAHSSGRHVHATPTASKLLFAKTIIYSVRMVRQWKLSRTVSSPTTSYRVGRKLLRLLPTSLDGWEISARACPDLSGCVERYGKFTLRLPHKEYLVSTTHSTSQQCDIPNDCLSLVGTNILLSYTKKNA